MWNNQAGPAAAGGPEAMAWAAYGCAAGAVGNYGPMYYSGQQQMAAAYLQAWPAAAGCWPYQGMPAATAYAADCWSGYTGCPAYATNSTGTGGWAVGQAANVQQVAAVGMATAAVPSVEQEVAAAIPPVVVGPTHANVEAATAAPEAVPQLPAVTPPTSASGAGDAGGTKPPEPAVASQTALQQQKRKLEENTVAEECPQDKQQQLAGSRPPQEVNASSEEGELGPAQDAAGSGSAGDVAGVAVSLDPRRYMQHLQNHRFLSDMEEAAEIELVRLIKAQPRNHRRVVPRVLITTAEDGLATALPGLAQYLQVPGFLANWVSASILHKTFFLSYGIGGCWRSASTTRIVKLLELRPSAAQEYRILIERSSKKPSGGVSKKALQTQETLGAMADDSQIQAKDIKKRYKNTKKTLRANVEANAVLQQQCLASKAHAAKMQDARDHWQGRCMAAQARADTAELEVAELRERLKDAFAALKAGNIKESNHWPDDQPTNNLNQYDCHSGTTSPAGGDILSELGVSDGDVVHEGAAVGCEQLLVAGDSAAVKFELLVADDGCSLTCKLLVADEGAAVDCEQLVGVAGNPQCADVVARLAGGEAQEEGKNVSLVVLHLRGGDMGDFGNMLLDMAI
eukprot:gene12507-12641_t